MRLSKIKLAGFKSFVDPTSISFPSNRVGIVGPNGCGKSNVIDAVRWVMGESSAKHLRGGAMTDVIFNGSTTRKPVEQASIELVFEQVNLPQYPPNSEISVKRQIGRDAQSDYFLNGVRCRRKDITDLFLGTGLGPRSYAIIEQGMISRLIEAKPDELRIFLEEAAGISKYKERRKETELRMKQTRDNLARLDEVRNELGRQLDKLQKQAKDAERQQRLKQEEALLKAQLAALRWNSLDLAVQEQQFQIDEQAALLENDLLSLHNLSDTHKQQREAHTAAQHHFNELQARTYGVEGEITRLEQSIEHTQERQEQLQWDLEQLETTLQETQRQIDSDEAQLEALTVESNEAEAALEEAQQHEFAAKESLFSTEDQLYTWQRDWEAFNQRIAEPTQRVQVERTRLQNLEQRLHEAQKRLLRLGQEAQELIPYELEKLVAGLKTEFSELEINLSEAEHTLNTHQTAVLQLRDVTQTLAARLHESQSQSHQLTGRLASLEALQEAALGKSNADLSAWLHVNQLRDLPRLAETLHVDKGWERAVEIVLGNRLESLCVENLDNLATALEKLPNGKLYFLETHTAPAASLLKQARLLDKIQCSWDISNLLSGVLIAENLEQAYSLRAELAAHESVITQQGLWLGKNWLCSQQGHDEMAGVLAREQELQAVTAKLAALDKAVFSLTAELAQQRETLHEHEQQRDQAQRSVNELKEQSSQTQAQLTAKQARLEHVRHQLARVTQEQAELQAQVGEDTENLEVTQESFDSALALMNQLADEREELGRQREYVQTAVEQARHAQQSAQETRHRIEVRLEASRTDYARLQQGLERFTTRLDQLTEQRYELQQNLEKQCDPLERLQTELQEYQQQARELEEDVSQAKLTVQHLDSALNQYEAQRHELEQRSQTLRDSLEAARMNSQTDKVRRQTLEEQLAELEFTPLALLAELPEYADEASWLSQIEAVERKLERLGSVNMAALQECEEQMQRKQYLDDQAEDLNNALNLLENAIRTIDRETRTRFQQTVDTVNQNLQEMFPRLFGGGQAYLQLTEEDILKAGVTIMARPPGKRNSTIHLLSGGEKTLTAIALVFAIFQLNPAPFCMLDEVDAPLDDVNVGRFCTLVKAMSERLQFIFISHNKITMEVAEQLIGVTMQEAGVSRPVAVDLEKAVDMVAA
jgi:chromosome segregation protein